MLIIGSTALIHHFPELAATRTPGDLDVVCTLDQFKDWYKFHKENLVRAVPTQGGKYYHCRDKDGFNYEFELAWPGTSAELLLKRYGIYDLAFNPNEEPCYALPFDLLLIKESHKFKRNSPHFLKTMRDIQFLREALPHFELDRDDRQLLELRQTESYDYAHPNLNVSKEDFFKGDGVNYVYDHDEIHKIVAIDDTPAYTKYMQDGSEVLTSKSKFFAVEHRIRILGGLEESMVLALERSQVPHGLGKKGGPSARWSFEMALMKVCTSITSGYFREFCWEHYDEILELYDTLGEEWYVSVFKEAVDNGKIVPRDM